MDNHTQRIDTAAIRALADAATPGPWHPGIDEDTGHSYVAEPGGTTVAVFFSSDATGKHGPANAAFIAAARIAVPALCDELDALREQLDAAQTALVDAETVKRERDALRDKIADYEQTCGDLCPTCGWRGLRGDPGECAFCGNAELSARAHNAERKIAKLRELAARYNGSGPHIDIDGEEACTEYDGAKFAMQQVLAILDEVNNA